MNHHVDTVGGIVSVIFSLLVLFLIIAVPWKVFSKAGYGGPMGCLMFIPILNLIALLILAFGEWPIERELRELRARLGLGERSRESAKLQNILTEMERERREREGDAPR